MKLGPLLCALALATSAHATELVISWDGGVPDGTPDHLLVPFDVPPGIVELEVDHQNLDGNNTLDFGLNGPNGTFRGWAGGTSEPGIMNANAATRGYMPGEITPGQWALVIGKAKLLDAPGPYQVTIHLRDTITLAAQQREPYVPVAPLSTEARWYAGDFHVHSHESSDAKPSLDEIAQYAILHALDFVEISDHNLVTQQDYFNEAQSHYSSFLFMPGSEFTTYHGHANAIGATRWTDHKIGLPGVTIDGAVASIHAQGALFAINHPRLDLPNLCLGCGWNLFVPPLDIDAVEIANGGWDMAGSVFDPRAIDYWDSLCAGGHHITAIGGSDDHTGGVETDPISSAISQPTTMVYAHGLSADAILDAVRHGRTVVKLDGPEDPMLELSSSEAKDDTISATRATLSAKVTGGSGTQVRFVQNGVRLDPIDVGSDPFTASQEVVAPTDGGVDFWRAEVWQNGRPLTITSNFYVQPPQVTPPQPLEPGATGCGCQGAGALPDSVLALAAIFWFARRRQGER